MDVGTSTAKLAGGDVIVDTAEPRPKGASSELPKKCVAYNPRVRLATKRLIYEITTFAVKYSNAIHRITTTSVLKFQFISP